MELVKPTSFAEDMSVLFGKEVKSPGIIKLGSTTQSVEDYTAGLVLDGQELPEVGSEMDLLINYLRNMVG